MTLVPASLRVGSLALARTYTADDENREPPSTFGIELKDMEHRRNGEHDAEDNRSRQRRPISIDGNIIWSVGHTALQRISHE